MTTTDKIYAAEKANAEIIACLDDYVVDVYAAVAVELENEFYTNFDDYDIKPKFLTVTESEIKSAVSKYNSVSMPIDDFIIDVAVDEGLPNWEREQAKLERKQDTLLRHHDVAERKAKAKVVSDFFKKIGIPKKALKISVDTVIRGGSREIEVIFFEPKTEKINEKQLEKIATYFENDYTGTDVIGFDYMLSYDVLGDDDPDFEIEILTENTPDDTPENTVKENKAEKSVEEVDEIAIDAKIENMVETTNKNWKKESLKSALRVYELERETLNKYERELTENLHQAAFSSNWNKEHRGKIGRCLAELVMAQTEYVNSLKTEIADRLMKLMPKNEKTPDCKREMSEMTVEELVEVTRKAAIRASYSAGLVEQAKSANTEREILDAMANYDANFHKKGYAVLEEWHDAINYLKFESTAKIVERNVMEGEGFTVGDYLEIAAKISA